MNDVTMMLLVMVLQVVKPAVARGWVLLVAG